MKTYIAIDIGGTHIKGALVNSKGRMLSRRDIPTPRKRNDIIDLLHDFSELAREDTIAVGIGTAGPIDKKSDKIYPPNIPALYGFDLKRLNKSFELPLHIENDADCFALAESRFGAGKGKKNAIFITLGTGIGGSVMIDGKLLRGKDGAAGEVGHMVIDAFSEDHGSGIRGSFENMASGTSIGRRCGCTAEEASRRAHEGDEDAKKSFAMAGRYIGIGLASLTNIFNPEIFVLGGSVIRSRRFFQKEMRKEFKERSMRPAASAKIAFSRLDEPGIVGAAVSAIENSQ
ncbi:MAG: ROK family protein [Candidatus Woesearchaeota archaeon]